MGKKINEENLVMVNKKLKKLPLVPKKLWELGLTKGKLMEALADLSDDTPIILPDMDHTYSSVSIRLSTALFDSKNEIINEDFGEDLTPESKYGVRKEVIVLL